MEHTVFHNLVDDFMQDDDYWNDIGKSLDLEEKPASMPKDPIVGKVWAGIWALAVMLLVHFLMKVFSG